MMAKMRGYKPPAIPGGGEPWFKVQVDDRVWISRYTSAANAVFGALRRLEFERAFDSSIPHNIHVERLPPKPTNMPAAAYTRKLRAQYGAL